MQILACAEEAGLCLRRTGRVHPRFGNGSLMAVVLPLGLPPERFVDDPEYCACLIVMLEEIRRRSIPTGSSP